MTREEAAQLLVSRAPHFGLAEVEVSGIPMRVYLNAPRSLCSLLESTSSFGQREFLVYEGERWTCAEHFRIVAGLAQRWAAQGVGKATGSPLRCVTEDELPGTATGKVLKRQLRDRFAGTSVRSRTS